MALTRQQKEKQVKELADKMKNASSVIFSHYIGLSVANITKLRGQLRKEDAELQVAKKTLIQLAAKEAGAPDIADEVLPGPIACVFSFKEPTAGAGITFKFGKDHPQIKLVGGIFSGKMLSAVEANDLAVIPGRTQLLGIFITMVNSPLTGFASAISSPLTGFARLLSEIAKKKESESPAPVAAVAAPTPATDSAAAAPAAEVAAASATPPSA